MSARMFAHFKNDKNTAHNTTVSFNTNLIQAGKKVLRLCHMIINKYKLTHSIRYINIWTYIMSSTRTITNGQFTIVYTNCLAFSSIFSPFGLLCEFHFDVEFCNFALTVMAMNFNFSAAAFPCHQFASAFTMWTAQNTWKSFAAAFNYERHHKI